jgi:hypothetical protein
MPFLARKAVAAVQAFGLTSSQYAPGSQTFTSSGTFTVPVDVRSLTITMSGGAGGGGGGGAAGGGQTGATSYKDIRTITVTPRAVVTITVGFGGEGGRSGTPNCGSNGVNWIAINNNPALRKGQGGAGYVSGGEGSGAGCIGSNQPDGGWSGGGGGSSAYVYSGGTIIAGGGAGGNGGARPGDGATGTGGTAGNAGVGNQGATGVAGGAGLPTQTGATYGGNGTNGSVAIVW